MTFLTWIIVGLVAGVLASLVMGGTGYGYERPDDGPHRPDRRYYRRNRWRVCRRLDFRVARRFLAMGRIARNDLHCVHRRGRSALLAKADTRGEKDSIAIEA